MRTVQALTATLVLTAAFCCSAYTQAKNFTYAEMHASCAPWDGPAVELTLTAEKASCKRSSFPNLRIYIWRGLPISAPTTIHFDDQSDNGGASLCSSENSCQRAVKGSITFKTFEGGKHGSGSYEFVFQDGTIKKGTFDADWCNVQAICG
jgi:hypothetical protein